jgi:hypothetical protein
VWEQLEHGMTGAKLPSFLVVGAAKAGTTALYEYLRRHPQVHMSPIKETNFFALEGQRLAFSGPGDDATINRFSITSRADYEAQFEGAAPGVAIGEASPLYLYSPHAPQRIWRELPGVKLVVVLRHPVDRAYSAFLHLRRDGREPLGSFGRALAAEEARVRAGWEHIWHYRRMGYYAEQLGRYFSLFDRRQIRVYLYEDLQADPVAVLTDLFGFLGIESGVAVPDPKLRPNASLVPRSRRLHALLTRPHALPRPLRPLVPLGLRAGLGRAGARLAAWNLTRPPLAPRLRGQLTERYREDIRRLGALLDADLSHWLTAERYSVAS